ncbi:P-loop containing nucleoside triphosphate hydrolase protein [Suillus clintonianus]|uniref:P-loop containing nucleoside triphosphate hydrolase protein n=1 Tax=Suillus clintonianus TaxID=1904413 RepID=UPI001B87D624|nr:P-loop containing nucleoside triphosphate hydrolase protein [Suillus clintonianus]KAG2146335.1 P-loop containing nucleoside triphosphate hydrolase protein [Suillus clintonianus]
MTCSLLARVTTASSRGCFRSQPFHSQSHGFATFSGKRASVPILRVRSRKYESTATAPAAAPPSSVAQQENVVDDLPPTSIRAGNLALEPPSWESIKQIISYPTFKAVTEKPYQFKAMTPVQAEVIKLLPELAHPPESTSDDVPTRPRDLLVKAKTGTGKTFAFLIPAIEARVNAIHAWGKKAVRDAGLVSEKHLEAAARRQFTREHVGTLIISPTRELATQIANTAIKLTHHHKDFEVRLFYGGSSKRMQMRDFMKGRRDIVVATPGRLRDLLQSEPEVANSIRKCKMLIFDEADMLLDMGFRDDIDAIMSYLPPKTERQTFLFSATLSRTVRQVAQTVLAPDHKFIDVVPENESPVHAHVPQYHTVLPSPSQQIPHLLRLIAHDQLTNKGKSKVLLFLPTTRMTQLFATLTRELSKAVLPAGTNTKVYEIHSKRQQDSRIAASDAFRADNSGASILVSSDVSARGVDYPGVTRVIQLGIPAATEQYIHRVGRTGRQGSTVGRGDLVLMPFEIGFLSWQLNEVPLKPVTSDELARQVQDLAAQFDADPQAAWKDVPTKSYNDRGRPIPGPKMYDAPLSPRLSSEEMYSTIATLLKNVDEEAIKETFASLLGYYIPKSPELRVQKGNILAGCRSWATEACGLATPPYVSDGFLQKMGLNDGRTKHFGQSDRNTRSYARPTNSWETRGRQNTRSFDSPRGNFREDKQSDDNDPSGNIDEYRGARYGRERPKPYGERERDNGRSGEYGGARYGRERSKPYGERERSDDAGERRGARYGGERSKPYGEREPKPYGERERDNGRSGEYGGARYGRETPKPYGERPRRENSTRGYGDR